MHLGFNNGAKICLSISKNAGELAHAFIILWVTVAVAFIFIYVSIDLISKEVIEERNTVNLHNGLIVTTSQLSCHSHSLY